MCNKALSWVFNLDLKPASAKFVLVAMCDVVDDAHIYYQSVASIAARTSLDRKTVFSALATLQNIGLITDTGDRRGKTGSIIDYRINVGCESSPNNGTAKQSHKRNSSTSEAVPIFPPSSTGIPQKQSQKRYTDPNITPKDPNKLRETQNRFDDFWAAYPRKDDKKKAKAKWQSMKLDRKADLIIADVKNRLENHQGWQNGRQFILLPTTYLNGERWKDEITPISKPTRSDKGPSYSDRNLKEGVYS